MNNRKNRFKVIQGGSPKRWKWPRKVFALGIIVLSVFLLWHSLGHLSLMVAKVTVARHTEVKSGITVQCVVARNEHLLLAPVVGDYTAVVQDGGRVRVGQVYARINGVGGLVDLHAPVAGLIRHGGDGFDGTLPTNTTLELSMLESATQVLAKPPVVSAVTKVTKNQPIAVIVDNNVRFQLLACLDFHPQGRRQTLNFKGDNETSVIVTPQAVIQQGGKYWVLWNAPSLPDSLGLQRVLTAKMITDSQWVVVVPAGALYVNDGEKGVFVLHRNKPVFNPVEVAFVEGKEAGVTGLADGQRVLSLPWGVRFTKRWWQK